MEENLERGEGDPPAADEDAASDRVLAAIPEHLGPSGTRARVVVDFARALLRRASPHQLEAAEPVATAAALTDAFSFVDGRRPGTVAVRVADPEVAPDGWHPEGSVLEVTSEDRQFIVTSVDEELHRLGHDVVRMLHPVLGTERGTDGRLVAVVPARTAAHRESILHVELAERVPAEARSALVRAVDAVMADVFTVTGDHAAMRSRIAAVAAATRTAARLRFPEDQVAEAADFLQWLLDENFVLAGCCELRSTAPGADGPDGEPRLCDALGLLARPEFPLRPRPADVDGPTHRLLAVARTAEMSTVHRQVPLQCVDVTLVGSGGETAGLFRVVGVLSNKAAAEPAVLTPVIRYKLRRILELEDLLPGSQDEAGLVSVFQALPKEELFEAEIPALRHTLVELLTAGQSQDVRALVRMEPGLGLVSALVSVPSDLYSPALRHRLEAYLLTEVHGTRVDADVSLADRPQAILRLVVHRPGPDGPTDVRPETLERGLRLLCRTWDQALEASLVARVGEERAAQLAQASAGWFPAAYRNVVPAARAVDDVLDVEHLLAGAEADGADGSDGHGGAIRVVLAPDPEGRADARLKVFTAGMAVELSRFLPILESLGLWAVEDVPYELAGGRLRLHDFGVRDPSGLPLDVEGDGRRVAEAALALWGGRSVVDSLNRLVLRAGMSWDDVAVLRAYRRYRKQVGTAFTASYVDEVLVQNAPTAKALADLFAARFDPVRNAGPEVADALRQQVLAGCDATVLLDHDRILRGFLALVDATLRTNRYLTAGNHLALKLSSGAVPDVPRPVPYREIFVHGPSVEGVHLRWGPVARGGIRVSDRVDDYRAEVLDLMRAQVLKNAVIVPTGAKGGFIVKRPPYGDRAPVDIASAYGTFVTSLLEVTDDVVGERVVPVARRRDGDDPYLVVAADRGTASFSNLANRISVDRGFWLGDAFASGGSRGYDHKRLGITARGAWVAIRQHLAELGIDPESEPVTVVGIGDMSGDVFGNGLLHSDSVRLVAAFDHRDIFIDPDPDPAVSYRERARLFALPGSSWQDYDHGALSAGGGVWSRLEKRILLSPEAQAVLRTDDEYPTAAELIQAILRAPVTLLFAGGIGTFVRASTEDDQDIDDRANTDVRVEAASVRARVVGEGANLAFTQRARIEYVRRGGHMNTDAIDNSAGVDTSDHEVNLKILLRPAVEDGTLTDGERDDVLRDACDDGVAKVLRNCWLQSMALTRAHAASPARMAAHEALMAELEGDGTLDRAVEALPTRAEMGARAEAGAGLTRPELAVLMAGAKRGLGARVLASLVPDQAATRAELVSYFPARVCERFDDLLDRHRLRRELVSSVLANDIVNRMGLTFVCRLGAETGARPAAVAAAYLVARRVAGADELWERLDTTAGGQPVDASVACAATVSELLETLSRAYLRRGEGGDVARVVARDGPAFAELRRALPEIGTPYRRRARARLAEALVEKAVDPALADELATLRDLRIGPEVAEVARATNRSVAGVAAALLWVGEAVGVDRLLQRLAQPAAEDRWSRVARRDLIDDLVDLRRVGVAQALEAHPDEPEDEAVIRFLADRVAGLGEVSRLLDELESEPALRLDAVAVATRAVRRAIAADVAGR
ncbi:MAG TPA: NAD-glutamate dehydrogenase domain-containing protein [Acidimicrobiales bacterium]|nr:NAD-glutamate dehydrogenase domain-containing protein [Acidimicrobiales bacterium]